MRGEVGALRRRALVVAVIGLGLALQACGDDGPATRPPALQAADGRAIEGPRDVLVVAADIRRAGSTGPRGALLTWWQALQFGDVARARTQYARSARPTALPEKVRKLGAQIASARPEIIEEQTDGARARLLALIQTFQFASGKTTVSETAVTFRLVRDGGEWKLADDEFLSARLTAQRAAERAIEDAG